MDDFERISRATPLLADLKPGGRFVATDLYAAGGVPLILKRLAEAGVLHEDAITVTGKTIGEVAGRGQRGPGPGGRAAARRSAEGRRRPGDPRRQPRSRRRRGQGRRHRAPPADRPGPRLRVRRGVLPRGQGPEINAGDIVVIRNEGPVGGPGMREMLQVTAAIVGEGLGEERGDAHRRPLLRRHPRPDDRPRRPRGGQGRPDRRDPRGRRDHRRHRGAGASTSTSPTRRSPSASPSTRSPAAALRQRRDGEVRRHGLLGALAGRASPAEPARRQDRKSSSSAVEPRGPLELRHVAGALEDLQARVGDAAVVAVGGGGPGRSGRRCPRRSWSASRSRGGRGCRSRSARVRASAKPGAAAGRKRSAPRAAPRAGGRGSGWRSGTSGSGRAGAVDEDRRRAERAGRTVVPGL